MMRKKYELVHHKLSRLLLHHNNNDHKISDNDYIPGCI